MGKMFWTGLSPEEARKAMSEKDKSKREKIMPLKEAVQRFVKDSDNIGIGGFVNGRQPVATIHEILRQGRKELTLSFQSSGLGVEYLASGMVLEKEKNSIKRLELAYWAHEAFGISPLFRYLAEGGMIELEDWSNFNMSARFKAGAMGVPYLPIRSPLGSSISQANRSKVIDCPFTGKPIMLLPAAHPHVSLLHVQEADIYGNCRIMGPLYTCPEIALASAHTIVTAEKIITHEEMVKYPNLVSIPYFAVDAVCEVPMGGYPGNVYGCYYFDEEHIMQFRTACEDFRLGDKSELEEYYYCYISGVESCAEFIAHIPADQLQHIQKIEPGYRLEAVLARSEQG